MKKNIFSLAFLAIIMATIGHNVYYTTEKNLNLLEVEALSDTEWNEPIDWVDQGFTKDEREEVRSCIISDDTGLWIKIKGIFVKIGNTTTIERDEIICPYGDENCTTVEC